MIIVDRRLTSYSEYVHAFPSIKENKLYSVRLLIHYMQNTDKMERFPDLYLYLLQYNDFKYKVTIELANHNDHFGKIFINIF